MSSVDYVISIDSSHGSVDRELWVFESKKWNWRLFPKWWIRSFCLYPRQFSVGCNSNIPDRNTVPKWVEAFGSAGGVMKRKPPGLLAVQLFTTQRTNHKSALPWLMTIEIASSALPVKEAEATLNLPFKPVCLTDLLCLLIFISFSVFQETRGYFN